MRKQKQKTEQKLELLPSITTVYLFLMLTVFLFWCGTGGYQSISLAKSRVFCVLCGGYVLIMILAALEGAVIGAVKFRSPLSMLRASTWPQRLVLAYAGVTWVSALCSPYFPQTILGVSRFEGALTISIYAACFLLVSVYGTVTKKLLWTMGGSVLLFCLLCLVQMGGRNPFGLYPQGVGYADAGIAYSGAYLGTIGNVDLVASFLCVVIPIMWVALLRLKERKKYLLLVPLAAALMVLLRMDVLAGLVGVFVGGLLTLPVVLPAEKKVRAGLAAGVLLFGLVCAAVLFAVDPGSGLLHEVHELLHGRAQDSFGSGRIKIWRQVLQAVPTHFWLGAGPDTMYLAQFEGFRRYDEALGTWLTAGIDIAHNEYLNILYHQGVLALGAYVGVLVLLAKQWITQSRRDPVAAMLGAGACGYCVQAFFGLSVCMTAPFFWLTLGLLEGCGAEQRKVSGGKKK